MRDFTQEHLATDERKYSYDFDDVLRVYMMRALKPYLVRGKGLELGCYKGAVTELLAQEYEDLTVVEAAADLIDETRGRVGDRVKFIHSMFEDLQTAEQYDAIFLMHTLEHIDEPAQLLKQINTWLTEKGCLYVVVPNANAPSRQIAVGMGLISHNTAVTEAEFKQGHRRTYTLDTLEQDIVSGGLAPAYRGGVFFKALANFQFDRLMDTDVMSQGYLEGCYRLGTLYPDLCASIYVVANKGR